MLELKGFRVPLPVFASPLFFTYRGTKSLERASNSQISWPRALAIPPCHLLLKFAQKIVGKKEGTLGTWAMVLVCSLPGSSYLHAGWGKKIKPGIEMDGVSPCCSDFAVILGPCFTKIMEYLLPWNTEVSLLSILLSTYVWEIFTWVYKFSSIYI